MNDINWRDINEDRSVFDPVNQNRMILAQTDEAVRIDWAEYINSKNNVLKTCKETVKKYAYID
jgi:hypothetical protein